jgi:hypothetical protein
MRLVLSALDPYRVNPPGPFSLAAAARAPAYDALFRRPDLSTYLITAYTTPDVSKEWATGFSSAAAAQEKGEFADLARYLGTTFPNKTFILLNWEGDNAIAEVSSPATSIAYDNFTAWIGARAAGVAAGRGSGHVYSGLEFNLVRSGVNGPPCSNDCVLTRVVPKVDVDYYSYSSYQTINVGGTADVARDIKTDLDFILGTVRGAHPSVTKDRILVGELGFTRDTADWSECDVVDRYVEATRALASWGVARAIVWQIFDNPPTSYLYPDFGIYKKDGTPSLAAYSFQTLFRMGSASGPALSCPRTVAMVDGVTYGATIHPTTVITLWGTFDPSGNGVRVRQGLNEWTLDKTNGNYFYESLNQINVQLPAGIVPGAPIDVFVTSHGTDSNGQVVVIEP